jgi:hypothetical protein
MAVSSDDELPANFLLRCPTNKTPVLLTREYTAPGTARGNLSALYRPP